MKWNTLRRCSYALALAFAGSAMAGQIDVKTTYDISGGYTKAKTEYKKAPPDLNEKFKDRLWDTFASKLRTMPFVNDLQIGTAKETKEDMGIYFGYVTVKKSFPAFVQLNLPKPVTFLLNVESAYRECKNPKDVFGGVITDCKLNSTLDIKGPISVYGAYDTTTKLEDLLRDKQHINVTVSRSFDDADVIIDSTLFVDSMSFESSVIKFITEFDVSTVSRAAEDLTRQALFLGAARVIRQSNERMLEL